MRESGRSRLSKRRTPLGIPQHAIATLIAAVRRPGGGKRGDRLVSPGVRLGAPAEEMHYLSVQRK